MSRHVRKHRVFRSAEPALFSDSWEELIPADHAVRKMRQILESLDLSYLEALYPVQGGVAYDPRRLLAVILYGIGDGVRSSRQLQEHCRYDNRYRFLMDGQTPDDRTFSRFQERLTEDPEVLLERIMAFAKERVTLRAVSVDGTKVRASVSRYAGARPLRPLADPDSRKMKDRHGYAFAYNCQLGVDADSKLIVGVVLSQDPSDWGLLAPTLDSVARATGRYPNAVIADRGYESARNAHWCQQAGIASHLSPNPQIWQGWQLDENNQIVCPAGHSLVTKDQYRADGRTTQRYRIQECPRCPLRESCLPTATKYRSLTTPVGIDPTPRIQNLYRARSQEGVLLLRQRSVLSETPHAQLKQNDGMRQFLRRSKAKAFADLLLWVVSYNIRKLLMPFIWLWSQLFDRKLARGTPQLAAA
jgi:transposase